METKWTITALAYLFLEMSAILFSYGDIYLRIVPTSKSKIQKYVAANFPFYPQIEVEALDNRTQRITTGYYSKMNISVAASRSSVCISHDASFQLQSGFGVFTGSICSPANNISISFTATNQNGSLISSDWTPAFTVNGDIYISSFGDGHEKEPDVYSLLMGAIADINNGISKNIDNRPIIPAGRKLKMHHYIHGGNYDQAVEAFRKMENDFKVNPELRTSAVLGFSNTFVSELLLPISMIEQLSVLSYANDSLDKFSNTAVYPYFNRMVYSESMKYMALVVYLSSRKWNDIILLESIDYKLENEFLNVCKQNGVKIHFRISLPVVKDYDEEPTGKFKAQFSKIKKIGVKIIVTVLKKPTSFYVFSEALKENVTSAFGYQWVGFDNENDFPHFNQPKRCRDLGNLCNFAFKGMTFVTSHYQINGYSSLQWKRLWKRYFQIDEENEKNDAIKLWKSGSKYGMAYDAIHLYAMAFRKLIDLNKTIDGPTLASTIRKIQITNFMMENVSFSPTGNPSRYFGRLSVVWPNQKTREFFHGGKVKAGWIEPWDWSLSAVFANPTNGYFIVDPLNLNSSVEVKSDGGAFMLHTIDVIKDDRLRTGYVGVDTTQRNLRRYRSIRGLFSLDDQRQVEERWLFIGRTKRRKIEYEETWREEFVPLAFLCRFGCGGNKTNKDDSHLYENGYCAAPDRCICYGSKNGTKFWSGASCETPVCSHGCAYGNCSGPNTCICQPGWTGLGCNHAICTKPVCDADGGSCIAPERCVCNEDHFSPGCSKKCTCSHGRCNNGEFGDGTCLSCNADYFGINCTINFYAVILPSILGLILLAFIVKSCIRYNINSSMMRGELLNDDWIVTWSDLKRSDIKAEKSLFLAKDIVSNRPDSMSSRKKPINTGTWNGFDVHYQTIFECFLKLKEMLKILHNSMPPLLEIGWRRLGSYASFNLQFNAIFIQCSQFCNHYQSYADFSKLLKLADLTDFIQNLKTRQQLLYCKNSMDTKNEGMSILLEVRFNRMSMDADKSLRYEIKILRDLQHRNVVKFVGACLQFPNVSVLTELTSKGSLMDILKNKFINLPWMFKYSLLKDICHGLGYIHQSEIGSHGRLKSSNCLIDNRWTLKLSGFGLKSFRERSDEDTTIQQDSITSNVCPTGSSEEDFFDLFWTPPEILKTGVYHIDHVGYGTKEGDVYSFAIIFSEICTRERPFEDLPLRNEDIVGMVADRTTPQTIRVWNAYLARRNTEAGSIARPCIMHKYWPKEDKESKPLKILIEKCWASEPSLRPIPKAVLKELESIGPNNGESIEVVSMLEKYSSSLEQIVAERAEALAREKQKTESLISRLLPRLVVEDLKLGKSVEAEKYDCISILFSDFVDFYTIVEKSTPYQVIETLDKIYGSFDMIVDGYDAHKLEAIGNAYMVVSGLQIAKNKEHADIVAKVALGLVKYIKCAKFSHLPERKIDIRLGIHSGSAIAGIVGFSIPRYCIFGDTVEVAMLMESTGQAMKIQISSDTKRLLEGLDYQIKPRGELDFEERGQLSTWWLEEGAV